MYTRFRMQILKVSRLCSKAICEFYKGGKGVWILCQQGIVIIRLSAVSFPNTFGGRIKGWWCGTFWFTMFGFGTKFEPHFWWHGWSQVPRHCCWWWKLTCYWEDSRWCAPSRRLLQVEIIRNHFSEAINQFYTTPMRLSEKYSREEVMKMMKLELFLILFPVEYLKDLLAPEIKKLM